MAGFLKEAGEAISREVERFRNRQFLEATMAAAALVATADGAERFPERAAIDQVLEAVQALKIYDPHQAIDLYRDYVTALADEPATARARALEAIGRIAGEPEAARILLKISLAIGRSDDELNGPERTVLGAICDALGLPRSEAGL